MVVKRIESKNITLFIVIAILAYSCVRIENLPDTPKIEFRSFSISDSTDILGNKLRTGKLTFYFEDGDGDLGLKTDSNSSDTVNLFLTLMRKNKGKFSEVPDNDLLKPPAYRIPYIEPIGQNDILKGTIDITLLYYIYSDTDTLYYRFFLKDRAGHFSNTDSTCVITLGETGLFDR